MKLDAFLFILHPSSFLLHPLHMDPLNALGRLPAESRPARQSPALDAVRRASRRRPLLVAGSAPLGGAQGRPRRGGCGTARGLAHLSHAASNGFDGLCARGRVRSAACGLDHFQRHAHLQHHGRNRLFHHRAAFGGRAVGRCSYPGHPHRLRIRCISGGCSRRWHTGSNLRSHHGRTRVRSVSHRWPTVVSARH
jgi:hypothetical protein